MMGTSWAVGSATTLALASAAVTAHAQAPAATALALAPGLAGFAYSMSLAAHGSRAGFYALAAYATAATAAGAWVALSSDPLVKGLGVLAALVGAITAMVTIRELRNRRGLVHGGALLGMLALLFLTVVPLIVLGASG